MKRKIYAKYDGWVYDHNGFSLHGKIHIFEKGSKWVITDKNKIKHYRTRLFFMAEDNYWVEIPKGPEYIERIRDHLDILIKQTEGFLEENPLSVSKNNTRSLLLNFKKRFFTNSIDYILDNKDEYRKI